MVLTPGQSATLAVTFAPTTAETLTNAGVQIASNAANSPLAIAVAGASQAASSHSVQLSWTASSTSGVSYDVFRATTSGGYGSTPLNPSPIAGTTFTDTTVLPGQTYFYVATAVDSGESSVDSNEVSVTIP
jgi:fibronectin type 3 domain-containing protein